MAKSKRSGGKKRPAPRTAPAARRFLPLRQQIQARAEGFSAAVARVDKKINRILLAILLVLVVLWVCRLLPAEPVRYTIIALFGFSLMLNGLSAYGKTRWVGFFLMVIGTVFFLSNLLTLAAFLAA